MSSPASIVNPHWPEAFWDVSGAFVNDRELLLFHDFFLQASGVKLLKAVFSDAEANSLKAEGDIVPTGIESIQTADQIEAVLNYPNPFSGSTTFSYILKEQAQSVAIQIFSTSGALVETIEGLPASVGTNRYTTSVQLPGGIYYYRLLLDGKKVSEANTMMIK